MMDKRGERAGPATGRSWWQRLKGGLGQPDQSDQPDQSNQPDQPGQPDRYAASSQTPRAVQTSQSDPIHAAVASLRGQRAENQDNYLLLSDGQARLLRDGAPLSVAVPKWPARRIRLAVFDGMGGHRGGRQVAEAAAMAAAQIPPQDTADATRTAILQLHRELAQQFSDPAARIKGDTGRPGTTLVWVELDQRSGRGWLASVGDSRVYGSSTTGWQPLSHDHSLAEFSWRDGELDQQEYQRLSCNGGQRLAQALAYGSWGIRYDDRGLKPFSHDEALRLDLASDLPAEMAGHADIKALQLEPGQGLLLASDGLWDGAAGGKRGWTDVISSGQGGPGWPDGVGEPGEAGRAATLASQADEIAHAAIADGGRDNVTVLLVARE